MSTPFRGVVPFPEYPGQGPSSPFRGPFPEPAVSDAFGLAPRLPPPQAFGGAPTPARPKVFVVHGRNQTLRSEVARFLEKGGAIAVILKEQSMVGQTLIDEFIRQARDVRFAVVLATADDEGRLRGSEPLHLRARQNVVLELGYFLAKLEKNRIAILADEGIELASDYDGVIYIPLQSGDGWRVQLAKAMKGKVPLFNVNKALDL